MNELEAMKAYNKAVDLAVYFDKIVMKFTRYHKYGIGIDMKRKAQEIACNISDSIESKSIISNKNLRQLSTLVKISSEIKAFPNKNSPGFAIKLISELLKQINLANAGAGQVQNW